MSEKPARLSADVVVRVIAVVVTQIIWFAVRDPSTPWVQAAFSWLYFEVFCACLFLRFMNLDFVWRISGAIAGIVASEVVLLLPLSIDNGPALAIAVIPPAVGHAAWAWWNRGRPPRRAAQEGDYQTELREYQAQHPDAAARRPEAPPLAPNQIEPED
jgi:hypothetical protein